MGDAAPQGAPGSIERLVRLAHEHLEMGVVYVAEFVDGKQVYRAVAGDADGFGVTVGEGHALDGSYCALMTEGQIPSVIPDSAGDARVRDLATTSALGIGAYVGVPLYLPDGQLYGSLCGLSHTAAEDLNKRDGKFLAMLAELASETVGKERQLAAQRDAIERLVATRGFEVALQPIVELRTGRCSSMEALARFPRSLPSPDVLFAQAAQVGLSLELQTAAVAKAVALLPSLGAGVSLGVNLSPDVAMEVLSFDDPLDRLVLEITEHEAVANYAVIREKLRPLREAGLKLAIDDAGAGFASLRHIVELQPDVIKVDRDLIAGIDSDPARRSALITFVVLALDIGATVVAEGVETPAELETVATMGVDAAQGYLLARPSTDPAVVSGWITGFECLMPRPRPTSRSVPTTATAGQGG